MAAAGIIASAPVAACPPPPPPLPSIEQQAASFRQAATQLCVLRLRGSSRAPTDLPAVHRWVQADGHWQVSANAVQRLQGQCKTGRVYFAEVSPAMCGGGLPPFDVDLLVAMTDERVLVRWTLPDSELAQTVLRFGEIKPAVQRSARP